MQIRILEDYEQYWTGKAESVDLALEAAYPDDTPGGAITLTVQCWERPAGKAGSFRRMPQWVTLWEGKH